MSPVSELKAPRIEVYIDECKGCQLCENACPRDVIVMSSDMNSRGFRYATYTGEDCNGCGICFYACPEPGAITVYKKSRRS